MQFLKTLFWVLLAVFLALFATRNWSDVTLNLWGDIQVDIKLPVLLLLMFLLGFLPIFLLHARARLWGLKRRLRPSSGNKRSPREPAPIGRRSPGHMSPIFVAIDTPDWPGPATSRAPSAASPADSSSGWNSSAANGPAGVAELAELGLPIFLDLKLHDIPNTVAKAVRALAPLEPAVLTVHAAGGRAMLENAKAAAPAETKVVAVTVLTSLDEKDLAAAGVNGTPGRPGGSALRRSPETPGSTASSAPATKSRGPQGMARRLFRRPRRSPASGGRRRPEAGRHPARAIDAGASILVIGRPITEADDPSPRFRSIAATL